jgi:hypothetical protein
MACCVCTAESFWHARVTCYQQPSTTAIVCGIAALTSTIHATCRNNTLRRMFTIVTITGEHSSQDRQPWSLEKPSSRRLRIAILLQAEGQTATWLVIMRHRNFSGKAK